MNATAQAESRGGPDWRELVAVILLSITTILTAWSGFQASKWGGAMSISFSQASSARIEASRLDGEANRVGTIQVSLFTQWLQAGFTDDTRLQDYLAERFPSRSRRLSRPGRRRTRRPTRTRLPRPS